MIIEIQMMIIETLKVSSMTKNVITVDGATGEEKEIAQYIAKNVTSVVKKTTSKLYADPVIVDQSQGWGVTWEGQIGPREEILMKLNVRMIWRT